MNSYQICHIKKPNGGFRVLTIPNQELKEQQRNLLNLIQEAIPLEEWVKCKKNSSIRDHVNSHKENSVFFKLDIKDCFPSINKEKFNKACCSFLKNKSEPISYLGLFNECFSLCFYEDYLPQGAPTSSWIANFVLQELIDIKIQRYIVEDFNSKLIYSRYMDDLVISGKNIQDIRNIKLKVLELLSKVQFRYNKKKISFMKKGRDKVLLTGLRISNNNIELSRDYLNQLRVELDHHAKKMGKIKDNLSLLGKLEFIRSINEQKELQLRRYYAKRVRRYNEIKTSKI